MYDDKNKTETGGNNIANSLIRNEYKLTSYSDYFLPSLRFQVTVNDMIKLITLRKEQCSPDGAHCLLFTCPKVSIYRECQMYIWNLKSLLICPHVLRQMILNHCIHSMHQRESQWSHNRISHTSQCEAFYLEITHNAPGIWLEHVKTLSVQRPFSGIFIFWRRCQSLEMYNVWYSPWYL